MMVKDLFVFSSDEDGISMSRYTPEEFIDALNDNEFGEEISFIDNTIEDFIGFFNTTDESALLVIQGQIIQPKPVKKVTRWTLADS